MFLVTDAEREAIKIDSCWPRLSTQRLLVKCVLCCTCLR